MSKQQLALTMNCDNPIPRVGFAQLKNYINKKVLFVGKIESMNNGIVNMQAPDGSKVVVQANSHYDTPIVEVCGVVVDPMTIKEESHVNFGENFGKQATVLAVHLCFQCLHAYAVFLAAASSLVLNTSRHNCKLLLLCMKCLTVFCCLCCVLPVQT